MQPYGREKRIHKLHPHNECGPCAENAFNKKKARQKAKKDTEEEEIEIYDDYYVG